jgi:hypothetical protein
VNGGRASDGATRATSVAILAGVLGLVGVVVATPTREGLPAGVIEATERLLREGPGFGRWRIEDVDIPVRVRAIAPWPADAKRALVGRVEPTGPGGAPADPRTAQAGKVKVFARERLSTYVSDAPRHLFFQNYAPSGAAVPSTTREGAPAIRVDWVPRHSFGGDTGRRIWYERETHEVLQVEDRSYHGRLLRGLYRIAKEPGAMEPPASAAEAPPPFPPGWRPRHATEAPFPVVSPAYVPPGFEPTGAAYHEWPAPGSPRMDMSERPRGGRERSERRKVRFAVYTWSDGLGALSVHVAPPEDMDAMQAFAARFDQHREPQACPSLPGVAGEVTEGSLVIRRRADACRTVLRVDDVEGVSVVVIGRNELPGDEYIRVVRSLARAEP